MKGIGLVNADRKISYENMLVVIAFTCTILKNLSLCCVIFYPDKCQTSDLGTIDERYGVKHDKYRHTNGGPPDHVPLPLKSFGIEINVIKKCVKRPLDPSSIHKIYLFLK